MTQNLTKLLTMSDLRILLVEDDPNFGMLLKDFLELNDYDIDLATDGEEGLKMFKDGDYHLCVTDVMMPKMDGFTMAKKIRDIDDQIPLFFLTAKALKEDVLRGYSLGADDYITKPFDTQVFLAKVKSTLKRFQQQEIAQPDKISFGIFDYDSKLRILKSPTNSSKLSPKENELLKMLLQFKNDLMPREKALTQIWHDNNYFTSRSMDVYIAKIRKLLKEDNTIELDNIHGEGFRLIVND